MKILHFHPDGRMAEKFIGPLIQAERGAGHDSVLVVDRRKSGAEYLISYDFSLRNVIRLPLALFRIVRLIKKFRPDVVVSHNTKSSALPLLVAKVMGVVGRVYFNHGVPYVGYGGLVKIVLQQFERWNCSKATHVLTVSRDMVALITEVIPTAQPRLIACGSACGIDLKTYAKDQFEKCNWRKKQQFSDDDVIVVFIGRPEKRKGFVDVLHLWNDYIKNPKCKLVLCGPQIEDVLAHFQVLPTGVVCLGFVDNIPEVLANSDILLLPSYHEGLSYAVLEAMACGAMVIANDIPGVRCLVKSGTNGYLVKGNSLKIYSELINSFICGEVGGVVLRQHARLKAEEYSRERHIPKYLEFIENVNIK